MNGLMEFRNPFNCWMNGWMELRNPFKKKIAGCASRRRQEEGAAIQKNTSNADKLLTRKTDEKEKTPLLEARAWIRLEGSDIFEPTKKSQLRDCTTE